MSAKSGSFTERVSETSGSNPQHSMSPYALWCVIMAASTIILDGLDNQVLGLAAPSLISQWGVTRAELGNVFALGFIGMAFGTLAAGWLGDRLGRRAALITGVLIFAGATLMTGYAGDIKQIAVLRTIAGVGLGGVPGAAAALIAEYTPLRFRALAVTAGVVCASLGGIIGSVAAASILPDLGWRWLFYLGGLVPLACAILLYFALPESPQFLANRPHRAAELHRVRQRMHLAFDPTPFSDLPEDPFVPTRVLISGELRRDTLSLSAALFVGLFLIYMMFNWAPTLLYSNGFSLAWASSGLTSFNIGGVMGAVFAALLTMRFGSRPVLVTLAALSVLICAGLSQLPIEGATHTGPLLAALFLLGLSGSAVQSSIYAVGAHAFPTAVRARGIGIMAAAGRIGAIMSAFIGAQVAREGAFLFFAVLAGSMLVNALSLAVVKRHIPAGAGRHD